ncbi:MAG: lipase family protein [Cyanobacteria bacterium P01_F01_bin.53]
MLTSLCWASPLVSMPTSAVAATVTISEGASILPVHAVADAQVADVRSVAISSLLGQDSASIVPLLQSAESVSDLDWLLMLWVTLTGGAITWGVGHYVRQQTWRRIEFLRQAVKEFEADPEVHNALKILDFEEYRDYSILARTASARPTFSSSGGCGAGGYDSAGKSLNAYPANAQTISFRVDDTLLCNALADHDSRARMKQQLDYQQDHDALDPDALRQYQIETALRDWFNKMLNGLEHFGYFLESGTFSEKELRPWLNYWIKLIADPACRRPGASKFYDALYSYIHHSGFSGVQKLFERFGYQILPSPYKDADLVNLQPFSRETAGASVGASAGDFSTHWALILAKASHLAYQDKQFVAEVVSRWGATLLAHKARLVETEILMGERAQGPHSSKKLHSKKPHSKRTRNDIIRHNFRYFNNRGRDTQAYLFRTDDFMVLAFRGSQEPQDWMTNFTTRLRNFTVRKNGVTGVSSYKGRVHTGFFLAWAIIEKSVLSQIQRWQRELIEEGKRLPPLYITGHSLGGALATMATAALVDHGINVAGVYTFGQPRVGDRTFVSQLNLNTGGRVFRFVNNNDIVPHVPPPFSVWNPTRLYSHVGTAKYFDAKGLITANNKFLARLRDYSLGFVKGIFGAGFDIITDHNMAYYISHLDTALTEEREDMVAHKLEMGELP